MWSLEWTLKRNEWDGSQPKMLFVAAPSLRINGGWWQGRVEIYRISSYGFFSLTNFEYFVCRYYCDIINCLTQPTRSGIMRISDFISCDCGKNLTLFLWPRRYLQLVSLNYDAFLSAILKCNRTLTPNPIINQNRLINYPQQTRRPNSSART